MVERSHCRLALFVNLSKHDHMIAATDYKTRFAPFAPKAAPENNGMLGAGDSEILEGAKSVKSQT